MYKLSLALVFINKMMFITCQQKRTNRKKQKSGIIELFKQKYLKVGHIIVLQRNQHSELEVVVTKSL